MEEWAARQLEPEAMPPVRELSRPQRRVLGVLVEKAFTVPESYPLTLKAATTGCNQKNNRTPVTNYSEDQVIEALDSLRELGLVAVVHTESGRTERYRHYIRKRFPFSEPQLAIITELLLRGRQQLGELRSRASRMAPIESLEELRSELGGLIEQGYVRATGPLDRRGVEVDHTFYAPAENVRLDSVREFDEGSPQGVPAFSGTSASGAADLTGQVSALQRSEQELRQEIATLREELDEVRESLLELRRTLGA